jgi:hypothetical protein
MRVINRLDKAKQKEKKDAKDFDAKLQPRSGGFYNMPGDAKSKHFLFDSKDTIHKSYSVTQGTWEKLSSEALHSRRMPVLSVRLGDGTEIVVLAKSDFTYIKDYFERYFDLSNS